MAGLMYYAVGPDDGEGWIAVNAQSEDDARRAYCNEWLAAGEPIPDFVLAARVPSWDGLGRPPNGAEWLEARLSYTCAMNCGGMASLDDGGKVIDGEPICGECAISTNRNQD
ncbi:hypothetical protein [Shimia ponticola]|uniref:hypothetical protein n=1 Tax=Shimia ponticola TaxID=2582893 RepID=UPI0011BDC012|nr:hypothetical protein [Shimia ponticola]